MNKKLPYKDLADTVASRGRYGDTTLIHVNPIEVEGLASLMPLTRNPDTGYPEAFLPLLAPVLGSTLAPALLGGTALGGALGTVGLSALGSGVGTTLATGSVEEGLMAGLAGFGIGSALDAAKIGADAGNVLSNVDTSQVAAGSMDQLAGTTGDIIKNVDKGFANITPENMANLKELAPQFQKDLIQQNKLVEQATKLGADGEAIRAGVQGNVLNPNRTTAGDILTSKEGLSSFGKNLMKPMNIAATGAGIGGVAVEQDRKAYEQAQQFAKDERVRKREQALRDYQEQIPGVSTLPTPGYAPGINNSYAQSSGSGIGMGNIFGAEGGRVKRMRFKNGGFPLPPELDPNPPELPPIQPIEPPAPPTPAASSMYLTPGYDPYAGQTGTRGRGLAPTPANYMAGFMPEYQYVTNIQPTASSLGALGAGLDGTIDLTPVGGGMYQVPTMSGDVNVQQDDPSQYVGGTAYNEFLLGNVEKGMPSYLDAYMQNQPYYRYQDQVLNSIYGGGGYGTPNFMGYDPYGGMPIMPTQPSVNPLQAEVDSLNSRINDLLSQIEGKDETIAQELATDQASRFGQITPDPKSDLIVQTGDNAGKLNVENTLFDYLSPTQKAQYTEYNYLDKYLSDLDTFGADTAAENFANYVANTQSIQQDTTPGSLISSNISNVTNLDDLMAQSGTIDTNTGNTILYQVLEGGPYAGSVTRAQYTPGGSYAVEMIYDVNEDGTVNLDSGRPFDNSQLTGAYAGGRVGYAGGGMVNVSTLEDYMRPLPMGNYSLRNTYQEGGDVEVTQETDKVEQLMQNPVIQEKMSEGDRELLRNASLVVLGRLEDDGSIIQRFVELFGEEAYERLKSELMPQGEQNIGLIEGEGGGMDDMVDGQLGDQQKVALSPGEYILPADVVSNLGDGNNEQGAAIMDDFLSRVRVEKHGTTEQPDPINLDNVMPR